MEVTAIHEYRLSIANLARKGLPRANMTSKLTGHGHVPGVDPRLLDLDVLELVLVELLDLGEELAGGLLCVLSHVCGVCEI